MVRLSLDRQPLEEAHLVSGMNAKHTERGSPEMGDADILARFFIK